MFTNYKTKTTINNRYLENNDDLNAIKNVTVPPLDMSKIPQYADYRTNNEKKEIEMNKDTENFENYAFYISKNDNNNNGNSNGNNNNNGNSNGNNNNGNEKIKEDDDSEDYEEEPFDTMTQMFIGSMTVVGLFVFYRLYSKTK